MSFPVPTLMALGNIKHHIDRRFLQPVDEACVTSQFDHFVPIAFEDVLDGIDRFFGIKLFQSIDG